MKQNETSLTEMAREVLLNLLDEIPSVQVITLESLPEERPPSLYQPDLQATVAPQGPRMVTLIVEVKSNGQPRIARQAVASLQWYAKVIHRKNPYCILMAPYISEATAEICQAAKIGYIDFSGNCRLSFGSVYIERKGQPNKFSDKRDLRTLYSPRATRILRVILQQPNKLWTVSSLSAEAEVSIGLVSKVKKLLMDREWVGMKKRKLFLANPDELLQEWSSSYSFRQNEVREYYSLASKKEIEARLASVCSNNGVQYALTAFSGASRLAPAVTYQKAFAFVGSSFEDIACELDLKEVPSGANVTLMEPYDAGVFYKNREVEGIRIASPIQIYLDLVTMRGRGEEAAEALLRDVIRKQW